MSSRSPSSTCLTILRKDWRLLWPLALTSGLLQALLGILRHRSSPFDFGSPHQALAALVTLILVVSMILVIALIVQQDPLPGSNHDWVVRPIARRELLLAKLLAVALFIHGPILLVQLLQGFSEGFPFAQIVPAALLGNFEIALLFTLPVMAVAAVTRSVGEGVVAALAVFAVLLVMYFLIFVVHYLATGTWNYVQPVHDSGVLWVWQSLSHAVLLCAAAAVLVLQYFRRRTLHARVLFAGGLCVFMIAHQLPWRPAFALQEWIGPHARLGAIAIGFDTAARGGASAVPMATDAFLRDPSRHQGRSSGTIGKVRKGFVRVVLPLEVAGLPAGSTLHGDRSVVWLTAGHGTVYDGTGRVFDLRAPAASGEALLGQAIDIPKRIYRRWAGRPLRLRIRYSLTLLRARALGTMPVPGSADLSGLGRCADRLDSGNKLDVACMAVGTQPTCVSIGLVQPAGEQQEPKTFHCALDYEPAGLRFSVDPLSRFQTQLSLAPHIDSGQGGRKAVRDARIRFREYQPETHFSRSVVIPGLNLANWRQAIVPERQSASAPSGHS